jgi:hypothetical protein
MKVWKQLTSTALLLMMVTAVSPLPTKAQAPEPDSSLAAKTRRFAPTVMTANVARLSPNDRKALQKIIAAAKLYDALYQRQIWSGNESLLKQLEADKTPLGRLRLHYFKINQGPWSQLDDNEPFIANVPKRPPYANFYPADITKDEFNAVAGHVVCRRKGEGDRIFLHHPPRCQRQVESRALQRRISRVP